MRQFDPFQLSWNARAGRIEQIERYWAKLRRGRYDARQIIAEHEDLARALTRKGCYPGFGHCSGAIADAIMAGMWGHAHSFHDVALYSLREHTKLFFVLDLAKPSLLPTSLVYERAGFFFAWFLAHRLVGKRPSQRVLAGLGRSHTLCLTECELPGHRDEALQHFLHLAAAGLAPNVERLPAADLVQAFTGWRSHRGPIGEAIHALVTEPVRGSVPRKPHVAALGVLFECLTDWGAKHRRYDVALHSACAVALTLNRLSARRLRPLELLALLRGY